MGAQFGLLGDDGAVHVHYAPTLSLHGGVGLAQQGAAVGVFMFGGGVGEVGADIAQGGGTEQGIGDGVQQGVGVGVAEQAFFKGDGYAAENERAAGHELVDVVALSDAEGHGSCLCWVDFRFQVALEREAT